MKTVSAVVVSQTPYDGRWLRGIELVNQIESIPFRNHADMNRARRAALKKVETDYWFFLDADDELPLNYEKVIRDCIDKEVAVAYTDELIIADGRETRRRPGSFDPAKYVKNVLMMHHAVVCDTGLTRRVTPMLPDGRELFESCLYFQLAKISWSFVDAIGYHWHKKRTGMHCGHDALEYVVRAAAWCARN